MVVNSDFDITVLRVVSAHRVYNNITETPIQRRNRPCWAVIYKRTGKTWYTAKGEQIPSDRLHPVILPAGCDYSWRCVEPGECLMIEFEALQTREDVIPFSVSDGGFLEDGFYALQKKVHDPAPETRLETVHRLYGLLLQLVKSTVKEYAPKRRQQLIQPAEEYIAERYFDPNITNKQLAKLCGISEVYFRKCFENAYGVPPIRYLHELRTRKAKDILSSDYGSIAQVAESVGYCSVYHFSKMFKTYTGQSPSQYAKASRG